MQWTPRILIALNLHRNLMAQDLLPNLRTLYLWGVEGSTLDRSFIFLSRTLKSITLNAPQNDIDIQNSLRALFSYLPHTCPNLEHIHMATRFPVSPLPLSIVKPLCHCTSLRTMRAAFSSFFEVEHLAVLLNLETLTTYIQDTSEVEHYYPSLPMRPVFRSLTSLTIESCSVLSFVQRCQFPVLEILSIKETSSSQEHIRLDALLNLCSPDLLRRLTLTCTRNALGVIPSYVSDIHPLLKLHGLRYFESNLKYVRGDSVLEQMAAAWPQLETLTFEQDEPCFTLSGLVPLVRCCPKLNALHIPLDAHNPQLSGYDRPGNGSSNPHISSVNFDNSLLDEVGKVAAFLSDLFPNLIDILVQSDHPQYDMWKEVERLVEYFVLVRMQERRSKQVMPA